MPTFGKHLTMRGTFLSFLFILAVIAASAQSPYLNSTSRWSETGGYFISGVGISGKMIYQHQFTGDTLINALTYYKVQRIGVDSQYISIPQPPWNQFLQAEVIDQYIGALREEPGTGRWYCVFQGHPSEELLYDFDLAVGQTLTGTFGDCNGLIVSAVDQVVVNGQPRDRFQFQNSTKYLIEGVGTSQGLFGYLCQAIESGYCLETFYQNNDSLVVDGCAAITTGIDDEQHFDNTFRLSPNPASEVLHVGFADASAFTFRLFNAQGAVVRAFTTHGFTDVALSDLPTGMYMACATHHGSEVTARVIVERGR